MATLSSHTARALADERVRELRERHIGERRGSDAPVQGALAVTSRKRVSTRRCTEMSGSLATAVRYLRRRVDPDRS